MEQSWGTGMRDEWKFIFGYIVFLILLLLFSCTSSPSGAIVIPHKVYPTYSITEPLGTIHRYRTKPFIVHNKRLELYCFVHGHSEVIIKLRSGKWRVRLSKR